MSSLGPEFKPPLARFFWIQFGSFGLIFVPLSAAAVFWSIHGLDVPTDTVLQGLYVFGGLALAAMALVAYQIAKRTCKRLESVQRVVSQMSAGEFDKRIPPENRMQIESLAASLDQTQLYLKSRVADLEASRNQLRTVLDSMLEGVIAVDSDQRVLLINAAGRRLFPIQDLQPVGRPIWELIRSPLLGNWVSQSLSSSEPVGGEMEIKAPVQRMLSVRVASLPGDTITGAIVVASDISQLRHLERVRQEFVANASHELKTPLTSIKACVESLLDGAIDEPEIRVNFLQTINEQSERLDRLVRDLLALTRIESEQNRPVLHPVELEPIIQLCVNRHVSKAERKEMRILTEPSAVPAVVFADEESLEQILDNLIDNAIKYTNPGGTITVRWQTNSQQCLLEVEDTGIGIPQAHQLRIFERFYRVDRARSREQGGTGLGLSIVKHLVQQLGGTVSVSSKVGKGSTFAVELQPAASQDVFA
ncbi:MAG: PAS domain-containing protein [Planctomycetes bacterium]|nr:PAS domain-containing protein [Planctomycetota bacterium]